MIFLSARSFRTKNIQKSIEEFAREHKLTHIPLSFDIIKTETYISTVFEKTFISYPDDIHHYFTNREKMVDEHVSLKQIFTITVKKAISNPIKLNYQLHFSANSINASISIEPSSMIPYTSHQPKEIYEMLLREVERIKAQNSILVGIFDTKMKEELKELTKDIYTKNFTTFRVITLFEGINPLVTREAELRMHFLQKPQNTQVAEVLEGELLAEFIKPVYGKNGFNAYGNIVNQNATKNQHDITSKVDETSIEIIEDDEKKLYKSRQKGFVHYDKDDFYIDNRFQIQRLSRIQESVAKEENNNIEVVISQKDTTLDGLGEGVELVSQSVNIHGFIGAKSSIKATNINIDGATHKESSQEAKFAKIHRHKGSLRCHSATIELLEGGEVYATNVEIKHAIGGAVYAENVTIDYVKNNLKVYASNSITIRLVAGEDNLFKIGYQDVPTLLSRYNFLTAEIEDLKYKLEGALKHTPLAVNGLKQNITKLKQEQLAITECATHGTITIKEPLRGINTIAFKLQNTQELSYKTKEQKYTPFHLEFFDDTVMLQPTTVSIKSTL